MNEKMCTKCKEIKAIDHFWFNKKRNLYHPNCKSCKYEISKKYINVTKEKKAEYDKKYREKYAYILKDKKKDEYNRNKSKYIERQLKYNQTLEGRIKHNIRTRIGNAIKRKSNSSQELLGCDLAFYFKYIEFLFTSEMSWDNYGSYWQIDHVKQLCSFDLTIKDQQLIAFNWKNTRPLYILDNLSKKKNTDDDIIKHQILIKQFELQHHQIAGTPLEP